MTLPTLKVEIDFSTGASFGYPFVLDSPLFGVLDINILADGPADVVDISAQVRRVSTRRGRNRLLSQFEAGTATVVLNDPNSDFSPQNTSSPYYGKLVPLRKIRVYADVTLGGIPYKFYIFSGYITSYDTSFYQGTDATATVTLQCVDGFRLLSNVATEVPAIPGATSGQLSGVRVETLLDFADFPTSLMLLDTGQSQMQVDPGGNRSILQAIQTIEQSEFGAFFMGRDAKATFLDRETISLLADNIVSEYSDTTPLPAGQFPYSQVDFAYDDEQILNDVSVQAVGGSVFIATDLDSINKYFYKSTNRTNLLMLDTAEAQDQASMIVATRKDAEIRIEAMRLNLNSDVSELNTYNNLRLDLFTTINITKAMPGGSSITKEVFVQGVNHDVSPGTWNTTVYTAEPIIQAFILDSTTQGILDTNALSY